MSAPTPVVRARMLERDEERCAWCGARRHLEAQHRQAVGMGGSKVRPWFPELVTLCSTHNELIEADADLQALALQLGVKVRKWVKDPALVPVFYRWEQRWCVLTNEGERKPIFRSEAIRLMRDVYGIYQEPKRGVA